MPVHLLMVNGNFEPVQPMVYRAFSILLPAKSDARLCYCMGLKKIKEPSAIQTARPR